MQPNKINEAMLQEIQEDVQNAEPREPDKEFVDEVKQFTNNEALVPCYRVQFVIHGFGALCMLAELVFDITYLFKQVFSSKVNFIVNASIIALRLLITVILQITYCARHMFTKEENKDHN